MSERIVWRKRDSRVLTDRNQLIGWVTEYRSYRICWRVGAKIPINVLYSKLLQEMRRQMQNHVRMSRGDEIRSRSPPSALNLLEREKRLVSDGIACRALSVRLTVAVAWCDFVDLSRNS